MKVDKMRLGLLQTHYSLLKIFLNILNVENTWLGLYR